MEDRPPPQQQRPHNKVRVVVTKPILSFQHDNEDIKGCRCITLLSDGTLLTASDKDVRRWSLTLTTESSSIDTQQQQQQQQQQQESNTSSNNKEGGTTKAKCLKVYKVKHPPFDIVELDPGESFLCDTNRRVYLIRVEDGTCLAKFSHPTGRTCLLRRLFFLGDTDESVSNLQQQRQQQRRQNKKQRAVASLAYLPYELSVWSISKKTLIARHNDVIGVLESSGLIVIRPNILEVVSYDNKKNVMIDFVDWVSNRCEFSIVSDFYQVIELIDGTIVSSSECIISIWNRPVRNRDVSNNDGAESHVITNPSVTSQGHTLRIYTMKALKSRCWFVTGSLDKTARVWNRFGETLYLYRHPRCSVVAIAELSNGSLAVGLSLSSGVDIWNPKYQ